MDKICLNSNIISKQDLTLEYGNRFFRYGDGFFETCKINSPGTPALWKYHKERINKAFEVLQLPYVDFYDLEHCILELYEEEPFNFLNIYFWRESDGLYTPSGEEMTSVLMIPRIKSDKPDTTKKTGISKKIQNYFTPYSFFKSDSLKYVLAGKEMKEKGWDDIIITDNYGNVSELLYSNIFWKINDEYYTPSVETGCIEGVQRNYLIEQLKKEGKTTHIGKWPIKALENAQEIFGTNAGGKHNITLLKE